MALGACAQPPGSAPACPGGLSLVPALGRPLQHKCSQWQGGCLSVCLSVSGIMWPRGRACGESGSPPSQRGVTGHRRG